MRSPFFLALVCLGFANVANAEDNAQLQVGGATIDISFDQALPPGLRKLRHNDHVDYLHNGRNLPSPTIPWASGLALVEEPSSSGLSARSCQCPAY
jgi:hypothetical protein